VASRGSVIPLFRQQRDSGTVTVTDERMTRFWITLEQGVAFVLRCLENMRGGEIFVPKIPSMSLMDLVTAIAPDAKVKMTGLRPGEKIHEVLVSEEEAPHTLEFPDMYVIQPTHNWWEAETWKEGDAMAEGFNYGSQNNTEWLSVDQLLEMVEGL
jgi:UDP-N-acetylglucosamine 4,6-dehydratase